MQAEARAAIDLIVALGEHLFLGFFWMLFAGATQSPREGASLLSTTSAWIVIAAFPVMWLYLAVMLIVWWRQRRGPLWNYPWIWMLMAMLFAISASLVGVVSLIALAALWFPNVRKGLIPTPAATGI